MAQKIRDNTILVLAVPFVIIAGIVAYVIIKENKKEKAAAAVSTTLVL